MRVRGPSLHTETQRHPLRSAGGGSRGKNTHPAMSMSPPTGVTAPRAFLFVTTIKYRDPEKRVVPAIKESLG